MSKSIIYLSMTTCIHYWMEFKAFLTSKHIDHFFMCSLNCMLEMWKHIFTFSLQIWYRQYGYYTVSTPSPPALSSMLWGSGGGCALGLTASKLFYSPDLERERMRCHHPEQRASRQHIPRKLCSHVTWLARSATAHNGASTSTQTITAAARHPSPSHLNEVVK